MENNQNQIKYYAHIEGPILFTAPHSKNLFRGGPKYKQEYDVHPREKQTAFLAVDFANQVMKYIDTKYHQGSFCIWGKNIQLDYQDLDPNYLLEQLYQQSPFHQSLHEFIATHNKQVPLFHVDIHGKYDRQYNCELDVGIVSMEVLWKEGSIAEQIKNYMKPKFDKLFQGLKLGQFEPKCNTDPCLSGYWGSKVATMTTQAIKLGIPSLQLQIPTKMRNLLAYDSEIRENFVKIIAETYKNIIVPLWDKKTFPLKLNENILGTLILRKFKESDIMNLKQQLKKIQQANNKDVQA